MKKSERLKVPKNWNNAFASNYFHRGNKRKRSFLNINHEPMQNFNNKQYNMTRNCKHFQMEIIGSDPFTRMRCGKD